TRAASGGRGRLANMRSQSMRDATDRDTALSLGIVTAVGLYLALGDSISIDDYTGVRGGGAPSQLARKLDLHLVDLTRDGNTTRGVLADLARAPAARAQTPARDYSNRDTPIAPSATTPPRPHAHSRKPQGSQSQAVSASEHRSSAGPGLGAKVGGIPVS